MVQYCIDKNFHISLDQLNMPAENYTLTVSRPTP